MNLCITESHVSEIATALFGENGEEKVVYGCAYFDGQAAVGYVGNEPANFCDINLNITCIVDDFDSEEERKRVIIHELGHALMMTHPGRKENGECYVLSVMNGGAPNSPASLTTFEPSLYDIYFLNQRWN